MRNICVKLFQFGLAVQEMSFQDFSKCFKLWASGCHFVLPSCKHLGIFDRGPYEQHLS